MPPPVLVSRRGPLPTEASANRPSKGLPGIQERRRLYPAKAHAPSCQSARPAISVTGRTHAQSALRPRTE